MEKTQLIFAVCFGSLLLLLLVSFLFFMLFWQRRKSNRFIREREMREALFTEQLLKAQLEIQEQSFNTISMEIHDNVGQTLSLLKVQLNIMDQTAEFDKALLGEAKQGVAKAMTDLRDMARNLNSERIQLHLLSEMAMDELRRISQTGIMQTSFKVDGTEQDMDKQKKLIAFRIIQETFQNAIKHSGAALVEVNFTYEAEYLNIKIHDDGKGFYHQAENADQGLGLKNIVKRAAIIGGVAKIDSAVNSGTTISIQIPYV